MPRAPRRRGDLVWRTPDLLRAARPAKRPDPRRTARRRPRARPAGAGTHARRPRHDRRDDRNLGRGRGLRAARDGRPRGAPRPRARAHRHRHPGGGRSRRRARRLALRADRRDAAGHRADRLDRGRRALPRRLAGLRLLHLGQHRRAQVLPQHPFRPRQPRRHHEPPLRPAARRGGAAELQPRVRQLALADLLATVDRRRGGDPRTLRHPRFRRDARHHRGAARGDDRLRAVDPRTADPAAAQFARAARQAREPALHPGGRREARSAPAARSAEAAAGGAHRQHLRPDRSVDRHGVPCLQRRRGRRAARPADRQHRARGGGRAAAPGAARPDRRDRDRRRLHGPRLPRRARAHAGRVPARHRIAARLGGGLPDRRSRARGSRWPALLRRTHRRPDQDRRSADRTRRDRASPVRFPARQQGQGAARPERRRHLARRLLHGQRRGAAGGVARAPRTQARQEQRAGAAAAARCVPADRVGEDRRQGADRRALHVRPARSRRRPGWPVRRHAAGAAGRAAAHPARPAARPRRRPGAGRPRFAGRAEAAARGRAPDRQAPRAGRVPHGAHARHAALA